MQTGKADDHPRSCWSSRGRSRTGACGTAFVRGTLVEQRLIERNDRPFYRIVDTVDDAVREVTGFYRVYHSARIVGDNLVFRLQRPLTDADRDEIQRRFDDILKGPIDQVRGPAPQELPEFPELPRLIVPFIRASYSRLRQLIDFINAVPDPR